MLTESIEADSLQKIVLSRPRDKGEGSCRRIDVRPVFVRKQRLYQFTRRIGNQELHSNLTGELAAAEFENLLSGEFGDVLVRRRGEEWTARISRKGNCQLKQKNVAQDLTSTPQHDRAPRHMIPDGSPVPFLLATGIMSAGGRVKAKHFNKFRQINRFVEFVRDIVPRLPAEGIIRVVDFGSGKSYLTFATHYYLTEVLGRNVRIVGIDRREDVVKTCQRIVTDLNLSGLDFVAGDISEYKSDDHIHLAISLHACDTATDDALAAAVAWGCDVILAAPCCHNELAASLSRDHNPMFSAHGIVHERFCELTTDTVRAQVLECAGYATTIMEFIDLEHTARNLLIKALKRPNGQKSRNPNDRTALGTFNADFGLPKLQLQRKLEQSGAVPSNSSAVTRESP